MTQIELLVLVPARGGSKGVQGKNKRVVAGVPLVAHAVRTAARAGTAIGATRVVCSTDDEELAAIAKEWGAEVPFLRPAHLATDTASSMDVVLHGLDVLAVKDDVLVVVAQPTSPLANAEDLVSVIRAAMATKGAAVSVVQTAHPKDWMWNLGNDGHIELPAGNMAARRQDAVVQVTPTGAAYAATAGYIRKHRTFLGPDLRGILMPASRAIDVDTEDDLAHADAVARARPVAAMRLGNGRHVGPGHPCFVIAEAGVNHNGKVDLALKLIDAAHAAGADAVKFQTFKADRAVTKGTPKAEYQRAQTGQGSMDDMIRALELAPKDHQRLWDHARQLGITIFSSPFDPDSVTVLTDVGVPLLKLASGELTNRFMLEAVAATGLPLIMSTGMATLAEIERALQVLLAAKSGPVSLLHCVSSYPAPASTLNLRAMATLQAAFELPTGWSDHSIGPAASVTAVAMGACIIEKHLTLDCSMPGPDHIASMEPGPFREMVVAIREVEAMQGTALKQPQVEEMNSRKLGRRSLVAAYDIPSGVTLTRDMLDAKRPGTGISSMDILGVVGRRTRRALPADTMLAHEDLE